MTATLLACDSYGDSIWLGWITEAGEEHLEEAESQEVALRRLTELSPSAKKIFVTDEAILNGLSPPRGIQVARRHRLEAIYQRFRDRATENRCLVFSLAPHACVCALVENGKMVRAQEGPASLSLFGLWQAICKENRPLKQALDYDRHSEQEAFLAFLQALRGQPTSHPLVLIPPLDIGAMAQDSLASWKNDLESFLDKLTSDREGMILLCSDWAGLGAFPKLLQERYLVHPSSLEENPLTDAIRGLLRLHRLEQSSTSLHRRRRTYVWGATLAACVLVFRSCVGSDSADLQRQFDENQAALVLAKQQAAGWQRQVEATRQEHGQIEKQYNELRGLLSEKEQELTSEREKEQKLSEQVMLLESAHRQQQEEKKKLEESLANLAQENAALKVPQPDQSLEIDNLRRHVQRLEDQLRKKDGQILALERQNREEASPQPEEPPSQPQFLTQRWYRTQHRIWTSYWAHRHEDHEELEAYRCVWVASIYGGTKELEVSDGPSGKFLGYVSSDDVRLDSSCP